MGVPTALWFLLGALPFCLWAAWSDLKFMRIPNRLSIWLVVSFLVLGLIFLPLQQVGVRLLVGFSVLVLGFVLNQAGVFGGGDAKFGAAMALFISPNLDHLSLFLRILAVTLIAALITHKLFGLVRHRMAVGQDWKSWSAGRNFPMGLGLAGALVFYLAAVVALT
jgi:prepilin peptidase CpaA